ncbi:serine/threonine protein kinase [Plectonema radiosum NIES-515]|uniref:Serine/threonine protein kinase n=2 Tax=Plectonema TaxID=1183 RepID=A0ABT3B2R2_9CYAN|nr:serine/threonine protein kinase [Plectonema radiosum NIES-515]
MEHQNFFHWQPGQWINHKYLLQEVLGQGGFGITYRATDRNGDSVVIKTLNESVQRGPYFEKLRTNFFNEAVSLNQCKHSHIVRYIEVLLVGDLPCLVMEYIQGKNLAELLRQRQTPLPEAEALRYIQQISEALIVVHNNKLLHRDVKPLNIMIRHNKDEAVLIDFGIARNVDPDVPKEITAFSSGKYTPIEQYQDNGTKYGPHTDIYALSATLYTLLTNSYFPDAETRTRTKQDPLTPPKEINPDISDRVNQAIIKGMERYPEDRPKSIQEWLDLLFDKSGQEFELLLSASLTGFIYGLLTFSIASSLFANGVFAGIIWLLILIGLIFVQYGGVLNIIPKYIRYFLTIAVGTAALVMSFPFLVKELLIAILILLVSTGLGFLSMLFFLYALPYVFKTQK